LTEVDTSGILSIDVRECIRRIAMSRVQLALNVGNLEEAIEFYSKLFAAEPAKVRPGYANFAIADPPLKLVLIENETAVAGSLNHLGVEVESTDEVAAAQVRLSAAELVIAFEEQVSCCYAVQDKVWVDGPGGQPWEIYTVLSDAQMPAGDLRTADSLGAARCATRPGFAVTGAGSSCC
jgi:catechol 2,3-dioxygenase-like lactoylglutathione lyase family enzyme